MSINLTQPLSPFLKVKMLDNKEKTLGLVTDKVQVVMSLPNISDFTDELKTTIKTFSKNTECFIITSSEEASTNKIIEKYELPKSLISLDFKNFANTFNLNNEEYGREKSLMIIDENCQIAHKKILL